MDTHAVDRKVCVFFRQGEIQIFCPKGKIESAVAKKAKTTGNKTHNLQALLEHFEVLL